MTLVTDWFLTTPAVGTVCRMTASDDGYVSLVKYFTKALHHWGDFSNLPLHSKRKCALRAPEILNKPTFRNSTLD
jgi:hypothetical protein